MLDALSADLCRAVTGYSDADAVLARLASENVFVTALDDQNEWYRYHHLFAELLQLQLERRRPGEPAAVHRAAAAWYSDHDMVDQAVRHWLAAGDVETAAEPAALAVLGARRQGSGRECAPHARALQRRPDQSARAARHWPQATCTVRCSTTAGWESVGDGRPAQRRQTTPRWPTGAGPGARCNWDFGRFSPPTASSAMLADAELALSLGGAFPLDAQAETKRVLGVAAYLNGKTSRTRHVRRHRSDAGIAAIEAYALAFLSLIAGDEGRWDDAAELDAAALERSPTMTLDISPGMFLAMPDAARSHPSARPPAGRRVVLSGARGPSPISRR